MKKPALLLLLLQSFAALMGYAQTKPDTTAYNTMASSYRLANEQTALTRYARSNGRPGFLAAALFNRKAGDSTYNFFKPGRPSASSQFADAMGLAFLSTLSQGTGIVSFSYNGTASATVAVDQTFNPTWTGLHTFNNSASGTSFGTIFDPVQSATANNQLQGAVHIAPTYSNGAFTGTVHAPLLVDWDASSHFSISDVIGAGTISLHASATPSTTNYFLREDGTNIVLNAPSASGTVAFRINNTALMTLGTSGALTLTNLSSGVIFSNSGVLTRIANGTANQVLGMNNAATANEYKTVSGSSSTGAVVTNGTGTITLSNDTTKLQTIANFFPKGDTRYLKSVSGVTVGGDLSGTLPNPTVAKFNGQLPSFYLAYGNLTGKPSFTGTAATGSTVTTVGVASTFTNDTTKLQTVANFFPKGDTRYLKSVSGLTVGGDLSGTLPNPTVAKFNGQLPSFYLNFANLTSTPTTIAGYNITDAASLTGTQTLTNKTLTSPVIVTPTGIVSSDVGLGNVDNTSDINKPVSTAQQTAINLKANDASVVHNTGNESIGGIKTFTSQVGVGTTSIPSGYLFAVNGATIVTAITVQLQANWPDYVFADQYKLRPLNDVARFISVNHHLPDMPGAQEVAKNGQDLGDMNIKLTKKVEELTLYLIEKDKQVNELKAILAAQEERMKKIEEALKNKGN